MIYKIANALIGTLAINEFIEREMNNPKTKTLKPVDTISIVIPCFNEEEFIETTLSSLREQTIIKEYPEYFELIIANNNSTDNSIEISKQYVDKIINVSEKGKLYARNKGIEKSSGNIIVAADADVYYPPFWLNTLLEPFNNTKDSKYNSLSEPSISGTTGSIYNPNIPGVPLFLYNIGQVLNKTFIHITSMSGSNSAFWKHRYYQVGRFNESFNQMNIWEMHHYEEDDFGERLSKLGKVVYMLNASCLHLGGKRTGCRIGITEKEYCINQKINIERFG